MWIPAFFLILGALKKTLRAASLCLQCHVAISSCKFKIQSEWIHHPNKKVGVELGEIFFRNARRRVFVYLWGPMDEGCVRPRLLSPWFAVRALWPEHWQVLQKLSLLEVLKDVSCGFVWQARRFVTYRRI